MLLKNTLIKIKKSLGRYLSLLTIVMIGVGVYSGIHITAPNIKNAADLYFSEHQLMDFKIVSTMGLGMEDVAALSLLPGVVRAIPSYSLDAISDGRAIRVHAIEDDVNKIKLVSGRMPLSDSECLGDSQGWQLGDVVRLEGDATDKITHDTFSVVGLMESPLYILEDYGASTVGDGFLSAYIFINKDVFDLEAYTEIYVIADLGDAAAYSATYDDWAALLGDEIALLRPIREDGRHAEILGEARELIGEAEDELFYERTKAEKELAEAFAELEDGRMELADAKESGQIELDDALTELRDNEKKLRDGKATGQREFADALAKLEEAATELEDGRNEALREFSAALSELHAGSNKLYEGRMAGEAELANAKATLDKNKITLREASAEIARGLADLNAAIAAQNEIFDAARKELDAAFLEIDAALAMMGINRSELGPYIDGLQQALALAHARREAMTPDDPGYSELMTEISIMEAALSQLIPLSMALDMLIESEQELNAGIALFEAETQKAMNQLKSASAKVSAGEQQLAEGYAQYHAGVNSFNAEMESGEKQLADGYKEYHENLDRFHAQMAKAEQELADGWDDYHTALADFEAEIADGEEKLAEGWLDYHEGLAEFNSEIADAEETLADGFLEYQEGLSEFNTEIADAEEKIAEAYAEMADIDQPRWYIAGRAGVAGYGDLGSSVDVVAILSSIFPVFFIAISVLMTSNSMARMVVEERGELGTLTSLGYGDGRIISSYLLYVLSASTLGAAIGYFGGCALIPPLIYDNFVFILPPISTHYDPMAFLLILAVTFVSMGSVTVYACKRSLRHRPAALLRPPLPRRGQAVLLEKIAFIWKRLSFTWKVTLRNIVRYKKRALMTIVGIAGCASILIVAYGLRDSMDEIAMRQFGQILLYEHMIILKDETADISGELEALLAGEQIFDALPIRHAAYKAEQDGISHDFFLVVPLDTAAFKQYYHLQSTLDGQDMALDDDTVIITRRMAKVFSLGVGDTLMVKDEDNISHALIVSDVAENYTASYIYMSADAYRHAFGAEPLINAIVTDSAVSATRLMDSDLVTALVTTKDIIDSVNSSTERLTGIVVFVTFAAGLLALVVLYNLTAINISERIREIATLKVLGFYDSETNAYIYREALILTLISIAAGMFLGSALHGYVLGQIEAGALSLPQYIKWQSYAVSAGLTMFFAFLMQLITYKKLKGIDMIYSLKSVE